MTRNGRAMAPLTTVSRQDKAVQRKVALAVFATVLTGAALVLWQADRSRSRMVREQTSHLAQSQAQVLQRNVARMTANNHALAALVIQGNGQVQNFEVVGTALLQPQPGLLALSISPGGVVSDVVPRAGNERLPGFNQFEDPAQRSEALLTRDSGRLTLAGPFMLAQGHVGVVSRLPIFLETTPGQRRFWGFSNVAMRLDELLRDAELSALPARGYDYVLWRLRPESNARQVIAASTDRVLDQPVRQSLEVPNGAWNLDMVPVTGWLDTDWLARGVARSLVLGLLLAFLAKFWVAQRQQRAGLESLVQQRTAQITAARNALRSTLEAVPDSIFELGLDGHIHGVHVQPDAHAPEVIEHMPGTHLSAWLQPEHLATVMAAIRQAHDAGHARGAEYAAVENGEERWFELSAARKEVLDGEAPRVVALARDVTAQRAARQEIRRLAFYDPLTDLPNRRLLQDRLEHALRATARNQHHGALMLIDMDNFKSLNDTLGHDKGDLMLQEVARRLLACMRGSDTVARLGGDEFVVLVDDMGPQRELAILHATAVAEKVVQALARPYDIAGHVHSSSTSVGIALFGHDALSAEETLKRSDVAMYQAKAAGRNTLRFFDPAMQAAVEARAGMEADIRSGLARGEFSLHYQPQVRSDGRVVGAEALARWTHPRHGVVPPVEFIAIAEHSDLILVLGRWVLETACAQLAQWAQDPRLSGLSLAINVSVRQFRQADFVQQVLQALAHSGAPAHQLKLEITESIFAADLERMVRTMDTLKAAGVRFALDDFGTGYSSLSYLKRLPLDQLKIDKSFVRDVLVDPNDAAIACTIVALARSLGLDVIAEGVETEGERDFLYANGCDVCQGYLFGRPMPLTDFHHYLETRP